ncbi:MULTISPECIES: Hsp33 family molecular chaperone HslO [Stenotrophomonas]|uniref:Hsp33 family molecular chaperone HslO n=1 Tax=Stenotrophomonas TaxID=40323 RepID=UPI0006ABF747|nr:MULTISPECIES: Hsp33 family molecular chaperone HslO [Stenotrophomonas]KOQ63141.1 heat shock protein Hsp33 [Stenotrophomonas maltophilia]MCF3529627.1 Hsp33 family molecular chaperone HslO [Stenotrophomonas maltophilia]MCF3533511.1 Hsp33 family molecular chaperone HslO [Stenotrophomonas maltophilia]MCO7489434.1 Hsp33 family molecular chaperone HslO [Stenotrophomonas maltophilia]OFV00764.1 heat-shock protein Hsp33 [Stenotrophomonas sp. HMSC10F07]
MTANPDSLIRFLLPDAGVRGVHVHLQATWQEILSHAAYPDAAAELLGEACVASALFTGHTKIDGRLSVQLRSSTALRTLFAECTAAGTLRGIAQLSEGGDAPRDLSRLGDDAILAITIENPGLDPREPQRYQSLVALTAPELDEAFEDYFRQSEQLPTRLLLAADRNGAAGLLLQKLPGDEGDEDGWARTSALFETLGKAELLATPAEQLLHRLFHEERPELLGGKPLSFACSCSRERVAGMLQSLGEEEARAAAEATGAVEVRCEFCGREYHFPLTEFGILFHGAQGAVAAPERLQ